jgi:alcohol dehydrogenase
MKEIENKGGIFMSQTMKAFVYHGSGNAKLEDVPMPQITKDDDIIIKVTLNAICTSDVHIAAGHLDFLVKTPKILGHEFCGEIAEIGSAVKGFKIGDRVLVNAAAVCGVCRSCKAGQFCNCRTPGYGIFGVWPDGCQAEYMKLISGANYTSLIPEGISEEDVILVTDMLCTAWYALTRAKASADDTVVVIGNGPVGLSACILAKVLGAKTVIAIDIVDYLLEAALKNGVADYIINSKKEDPVAKVSEITKRRMADCIIETVGISQTINLGIALSGFAGRMCTVALPSGPLTIERNGEALLKNMDITMGVHSAEGAGIIMDHIVKGKIDAKWMLTHKAPLNDIVKGYDIFSKKKDNCIKWLVTPYQK